MEDIFTYNSVHLHDDEFRYIQWGGSGPLVHISHAIGFCSGLYTPFACRLTNHFQIIGLDSRGHGQTKAPADPQKLKNWNILYDDLECFFQYLNKPLIAIGHSMGGTMSLVAAIRRPELVRALILIKPGIIPPAWRAGTYLLQKCGLTGIVPMVSRTAKKKSSWPDWDALRFYLSDKGLFRNWQKEFIEAYQNHIATETGEGVVSLCCDPKWEARCIAMAPTDIWKYVPRLRTPTLVLYGERTQTFLPSVIKKFKSQVPHSVFHRFAGAGHNVIMEKPDEAVTVIINFLIENGII